MKMEQPTLFDLEPPPIPLPSKPVLKVMRVVLESPNSERRFEVEITDAALASWTKRGWKVIEYLES